jgi:hydrogenase maturation protease
MARVAVFGIGNRSRGDDAAGPLLLERLAGWLAQEGRAEEFDLFEEYQLQPENALDLEGRRLALFIDAAQDLESPCRFVELEPAVSALGVTSHALSPSATLAVYRRVTGSAPPPAFALGVRAERFELGEPPGASARAAMREAWRLLADLCRSPDPRCWRAEVLRPSPSPSAPLPS